MESRNAFIGKTTQPKPKEIAAALGASAEAWKQLLDWFATEHGIAELEWKSFSSKYGWSLRPKLKKRTILHLGPCNGCFQVAVVLGDRAVEAARNSNLSKSVLKLLDEATHYVEGTGIRLLVKRPKDLAPIRKLTLIKLAN